MAVETYNQLYPLSRGGFIEIIAPHVNAREIELDLERRLEKTPKHDTIVSHLAQLGTYLAHESKFHFPHGGDDSLLVYTCGTSDTRHEQIQAMAHAFGAKKIKAAIPYLAVRGESCRYALLGTKPIVIDDVTLAFTKNQLDQLSPKEITLKRGWNSELGRYIGFRNETNIVGNKSLEADENISSFVSQATDATKRTRADIAYVRMIDASFGWMMGEVSFYERRER